MTMQFVIAITAIWIVCGVVALWTKSDDSLLYALVTTVIVASLKFTG